MKYVLPAFSPRKPAPSRARRRSAGEHGDAAPARASRAPTSGAPRLPQLRRVKFTGISHRRGKITFRAFFFFKFNTMPGFNHQSHSALMCLPATSPALCPLVTIRYSQHLPPSADACPGCTAGVTDDFPHCAFT